MVVNGDVCCMTNSSILFALFVVCLLQSLFRCLFAGSFCLLFAGLLVHLSVCIAWFGCLGGLWLLFCCYCLCAFCFCLFVCFFHLAMFLKLTANALSTISP